MSKGGRVLIKGFKPVKVFAKVKSNVQYMGRESDQLGQNREQYFSRDEDLASDGDFLNRVKSNRALQHGSTVKAFKLVFSLKEQDYRAYKRSGKDYKDIIRNVLGDYERKHAVKLDWIAHVHDEKSASSHPHCHVTIKGVSDTLGDRGYSRIYLTQNDFSLMKSSFEQELEREAQYKWHERIDTKEILKGMAKSFEAATMALDGEAKEQLRGAELKRHAKRRKAKQKEQERGR